MSAASNFLEAKLLDHALRVTAYNASAFTASTTLYLALFNNTSGNAAANLEAGTLTDETSTSSTGYGRKAVAFAAASGTNPCSSATNATVTFDAATASWGTITHIAVMDAATSGNVLFYGAVTTSKTIDTGDTFQVSSGNLTISLA
jgi:hypothetical protein